MDLTCTGCGGRLPPEGARETVTCRYCGATCVPPPEVIEHVVERVVVQRIPLPTGGEAGPPGMPCPRCAAYLKEKRVHAALIAACRECGGIWVDAATVERLKSAHDEELENALKSSEAAARWRPWIRRVRLTKAHELSPDLERLLIDKATAERLKSAHDEELENAARRINGPLVLVGPPPDQRLAISCPVCSGPLRRVEIPDTMHSVDVCDVHGTWFDRCNGDELQMFVTSFAEARAGEVTEGDLRSAGAYLQVEAVSVSWHTPFTQLANVSHVAAPELVHG